MSVGTSTSRRTPLIGRLFTYSTLVYSLGTGRYATAGLAVSEPCSPAISHLDTEVIGVAAPHGNHSGAGDKMHGFER